MSHSPGCHGLLDLYGCPSALLRDEGYLKNALRQAAERIGATVLDSRFHTFGGEGGVTGVLLLAESHMSIHTWPEHGFAALDIFLCGSLMPESAKNTLEQALQAERGVWQVHQRGGEAGLPLR
ncbi:MULTISPECIES: adenosylmethionine decarboxylase [Eikenella]|uniref:S-adenosylmethionine decarboxylase proenzyme n=1 Tax=Eikenella longinqua TaxID=1795827 RepID=A0A1A9S381_9NEIS|nr:MULTISPECIES: adenosylmethionine decarboxylase [Eikenella]OAM31557.1 S-adenosylmethionine decarboxylase proenzyme [Eikenella longinqua]